ncbi:MAG: hypothetical protein COZ06_24920 [Armatimonadetes bacterium CG_4_10_14_3_um_filter_66_18]|nr:hypothetical protein [Armatimonadota bacterium]OIP07566.1 MAG: hypothetical protein AUJ96_07085 [Armatimonadetes bacterium CG2_30_66_41]PIU93887.1 MAG: hypothetical protein COS65_10485 [Armatimonadetes bacterium CG06_land_8_20_14_3_00_66_21]PIX41064.1 MAG: hypothetical protein COZ57_24395 [Armatimonadetes bacterium CG_4_8_14_3_um_filter_66_20]PIY42584.1 MAG: hypothetical protein COZ06_24920 [Armatimonadetes bacterium CG_4_10_14_3_um_filter_66_18]PIZ46814.1 MAG: hypothetical protein COY42_09
MLATLMVLAFVPSQYANAEGGAMPDQQPSTQIHVAPDGNDTWSGALPRSNAQRTDGPLATLQAAVEAARRLGAGKPRGLLLQAGNYFLEKPLDLGAEDAGLTIEAAAGTKVTLLGGRRLTGWQRDGDRLWSAALAEVGAGKWDFRMLVVNGRLCKRARLPKEGFFLSLNKWDVPWMSTTGGGWKRKPTPEELTTMQYKPEDLPADLDLRNAELTVYHMWDESVVGVRKRDETTQTLTFANPAGHPPGAFHVNKYVVWNVREGMTEPGQWYLDRTAGKVVYWPLPGEDLTKAEGIAPTMEWLIQLQGTKEKPVRNVTLRGLTLSVTNTPLKAGGFGAGGFAGALTIAHSQDCLVDGCEIVNVGGQGIKEWNSTGLRIERCHAHNTGACGIKCGGGDLVVSDCDIHNVGVTYPSAIALWGGGKEGKGCQFLHNAVHDCPYTAIACGGDNHLIEGNLMYHAMQELHDGAAIYLTFCKRITVRGNFVRDIVDTGGYGASAYYLDEQAEDCLVEGNLSLRVSRPSHNHMAKNNTVRNNVFVADGDLTLTFPKSSDYTLENNVIAAKGKIAFTNPAGIAAFRSNVLFSAKGDYTAEILDNYSKTGDEALKAGESNAFADPVLTEFEDGKVRFAPGSPAVKLGTKQLDVSGAGPRANG